MDTKPSAGKGLLVPVGALGVIAAVTALVWLRSVDLSDPPAEVAEAPELSPPGAPVAKAPTKSPLPAEVAAVSAVAAFAQREIPGESPNARASTAEGMRLIAAAIAARGDSVLWRDRAVRLGESADQVAGAADSTAAAAIARDALLQAAEWIVDLPARSKDGSRDTVVPAAKAIQGKEPLRNQARELEEYFDAAARALGGASI
jgi:hypothetical protein